MQRRAFLLSLTATPRVWPARSSVKITTITLATIEGRFHRFVAMNSYDKAPKGHTYTNTLVRIATDQGVEGIGVMEYAEPDDQFRSAIRSLVGANPLEIYSMSKGCITGRSQAHRKLLAAYPHLDGPLFDLIGKLTEKPAWQLIGPAVRDRVEVYDGTLYFSDIWFRDRGVRAVLEEAEEAAKKGYRGMKFKLGRGYRWMDRDAGLARDVEVMRTVRKELGPDIKLLADANNGYRDDFERAWKLMDSTKETHLYWMEEIFPESIEMYTKLRERMKQAGINTLIADGENMGEANQFAPYLKPARLMDILQMDIRRGGFLGNLEMAHMGGEVEALSVPHNWGSQIGLFMGLHLAKAVKAVSAAEDDRSTCDAIIAEGYEFKEGTYSVSNAHGLGIRIDEKVFRDKYKSQQVVIN
jgi:L-alanine-DL-glutamate epimerase-like enolase superfamily enzyme